MSRFDGVALPATAGGAASGRPQYESVRSIFVQAAEHYDALAERLARIAERVQR